MPSFSTPSVTKLKTCDIRLQNLMNEVIKHIDIGITCGYRNQVEQEEAFNTGKSKVHYPNGKHNSFPSAAVDFVPYVNGQAVWGNKDVIIATAFFIKGVAAFMGIKIRLGCDWNGNFDYKDENFLDAFHIELAD